MSFDEIRFPTGISSGAKGGPEFRTRIITLGSGFERRNQDWSVSRARYNIGTGIKSRADMDAIIAFFRARYGMARGFRYKDWADYTVTGSEGVLTTLTASTQQLCKRYPDSVAAVDRKIQKPVSAISLTGTGTYTVDYTTGIVTTVSGALATAWTGDFDVPVRFDTDLLDGTINFYDVEEWPQIPLVELRI